MSKIKRTCFVCGKPINDNEETIWFGLDGDKIHKRCESNLDAAYSKIDNMSDSEFSDYLLGKTNLME